MQPTDKLSRDDFLRLTARGSRQVDNEIEAGSLIYWGQPNDAIRASNPKKRWPREFIAIDAVLVVLADLMEESGLKRSGLTVALPGMQLMLPAGVDRPDTMMMIALGRTPGLIGVGCGTADELLRHDLFVGKKYRMSWRMRVAGAVDVIRDRARRFKIKLPSQLAPPASDAPLRMRGIPPEWIFEHADGRTSKWSPTHTFVQTKTLDH
jgi:hypothetical protein